MECLICGAYFNEPRFLKDLFRTKSFIHVLNVLRSIRLKLILTIFL